MTAMKERLIEHTNTTIEVKLDCSNIPKAVITYEAVLWTDPADRESLFELKDMISRLADVEVAKWAGLVIKRERTEKASV